MNPTLLIAGLVWCCVTAAPARSDWTVQLPERNPADRAVSPVVAGPGGVGIRLNGDGIRHFLWYSTNGVLLAELSDSDPILNLGDLVFLSPRQLLIPLGGGPGARFLLVTSNGPGDFTTKTYSLTSSQGYLGHLVGHQGATLDYTGFYYTDEASWTLTRVDFPTPPPMPGASVALGLQSAEKLEGPWQDVRRVEVPSDKPQRFFRLEAQKR